MDENKAVEVDLDILPSGEIRFPRSQREECRDFLLEVMENVLEDEVQIQAVKDFLDGANDMELILGGEILCG